MCNSNPIHQVRRELKCNPSLPPRSEELGGTFCASLENTELNRRQAGFSRSFQVNENERAMPQFRFILYLSSSLVVSLEM